jgi:hypothetical protein
MSKPAAKVMLILAVILGTSAVPAAERTFDKRLDAPPGGRLTFAADVGSVAVTGTDTRQVIVHADLEGSETFLDRLHVSAEQTPGGVTILLRKDRNGWFPWFNLEWGGGVRFTVDVPRDYPVDLKTAGGGIDVRNLNASVNGDTSGGGIRVQNVAGTVDVHTSGGGIEAQRLNGAANLSTSGGSIGVTDATGDLYLRTSGGGIRVQNGDGRVDAHTSGGSIRAQFRSNEGIDLGTSGGGITLLLPQNTHAAIDAATSGGSVSSELPVSTIGTVSGNHLRGSIGGGGPPISLHTSGGSIRIEPES